MKNLLALSVAPEIQAWRQSRTLNAPSRSLYGVFHPGETLTDA